MIEVGTSLHIGARKGDLKQVKHLLDEGMDVNVPAWGPKSKGLTALHLAAQGGHLEIMDELLARGANIDARTLGACGTPLHRAAKERKKEAVKFLIENGAFLPDDMNDCRFNPPLHYCTGLEWAYEEMKRHSRENFSSGESILQALKANTFHRRRLAAFCIALKCSVSVVLLCLPGSLECFSVIMCNFSHTLKLHRI
ncbi:hypothetical protein NC651_001383 [Populus alba x Populus x berolinensis]|nr:hypothetical protein NC651_001383 [Populus alba x Populus x berolinensis]